MNAIWMLMALPAGTAVPVQTGTNMTLARNWSHHPW